MQQYEKVCKKRHKYSKEFESIKKYITRTQNTLKHIRVHTQLGTYKDIQVHKNSKKCIKAAQKVNKKQRRREKNTKVNVNCT